jgi:2-dehydro-3-deoxy-D-arabinonate dehydratase
MIKVYRDKQGPLILHGEAAYRPDDRFLAELFQGNAEARVSEALASSERVAGSTINWEETEWLAPLEEKTEVWAAGVTYFRSRVARMEESEESAGEVFYDMVYEADRPELFFKSTGWAARGHRASVRVRADSAWDVPEPELTLAIDNNGKIFGFTIGNDMSSRSIEGENPLYLPQAKVYRGSCAVGPCILIGREAVAADAAISIQIQRSGEEVFSGNSDLTKIKRDFQELTDYLYRENEFSAGALLMTGTGIVPDADFTLKSGDVIRITIDGIGQLENTVE